MTEPCRALRGLLEAVVREYRRIFGQKPCGHLPARLCRIRLFFAGRQATSTCWWLYMRRLLPAKRKGWCAPCWRRAPLRRPPGSR